MAWRSYLFRKIWSRAIRRLHVTKSITIYLWIYSCFNFCIFFYILKLICWWMKQKKSVQVSTFEYQYSFLISQFVGFWVFQYIKFFFKTTSETIFTATKFFDNCPVALVNCQFCLLLFIHHSLSYEKLLEFFWVKEFVGEIMIIHFFLQFNSFAPMSILSLLFYHLLLRLFCI